MKRLITFLFFTLLCAFASARNVQFETINTEAGLSHAGITAFAQDQKGYMWIGTQEGLNRYDGYEFKTFENDVTNPESLGGDWIWSLLVDHQGQLWIGTNTGGLSRYDEANDRFINYQNSPDDPTSLQSNQVRFVFEDSKNVIWVGTKGGGLSRFNPETESFVHYTTANGLPNNSVNVIYEWDGTLLVGTDAGLAVFDSTRSQLSLHEAGGNNQVRTIREFQGELWIGTHKNGIRVFNPLDSKVTSHVHDPDVSETVPGNLIRDLLIDHQGTLWIATDSGLAEWRPYTERFISYLRNAADSHSISDNRIDSLFQDNGNVFWVGTYNGISRWNYVSDAFNSLDSASGHLTHDIVTALAESREGELWIGTYGGGIARLVPDEEAEDGYRSAEVPAIELEDQRVTVIDVDKSDNVWIGTRTSGLYRLNPQTGGVTHYRHDPSDPGSLSSDGVTALFTRDNGIWVGTYGGGLNRFESETGSFTHYRSNAEDESSLGSDRVLSIYRDQSGAFWIGTEDGGLNRFNALQGTFTRYQHDPTDFLSISNDTAWEITETKDGSLWIGTLSGGLNRWSAENREKGRIIFERYTKKEGLLADTIFGILEGSDGEVWLSGNRGLSVWNPQIGAIRHFDQRNGLKGNEFNFGASLVNRKGELMFGGVMGIVAFHPADVSLNPHAPDIVVSASSNTQSGISNHTGTDELTELTLPYTDTFVDFRFAALDFASPDKNQYLYMLEGFDIEWQDPGQFRRATYTNLPPGSYQFMVRASNNDNVWNENAAVIPLTVVPPPWLSAWAYTLYVLIIGGVVVTYVTLQRRKFANAARMQALLEDTVKQRTSDLDERNQQLEIANEQLTLASMSDALTGLHNRRYLYDYLESQIASLNRFYTKVADEPDAAEHVQKEGSLFFMMIDLDGFKVINDTYGHSAGDDALIQVREVLKSCTRESDTIIRWGGDEFLVVGQSEGLEGIELLAERVRAGITDHDYVVGEGKVGYLAGSIGFAHYPFNPHQPRQFTWEQVVALADQAAYISKDNGGNAWVSFSGTKDTEQADIVMMRDDPGEVIRHGKVLITTSAEGELLIEKSSKRDSTITSNVTKLRPD